MYYETVLFQMGLILRPHPRVLELEREPVISELGIYGTYVRSATPTLSHTAFQL